MAGNMPNKLSAYCVQKCGSFKVLLYNFNTSPFYPAFEFGNFMHDLGGVV